MAAKSNKCTYHHGTSWFDGSIVERFFDIGVAPLFNGAVSSRDKTLQVCTYTVLVTDV